MYLQFLLFRVVYADLPGAGVGLGPGLPQVLMI